MKKFVFVVLVIVGLVFAMASCQQSAKSDPWNSPWIGHTFTIDYFGDGTTVTFTLIAPYWENIYKAEGYYVDKYGKTVSGIYDMFDVSSGTPVVWQP